MAKIKQQNRLGGLLPVTNRVPPMAAGGVLPGGIGAMLGSAMMGVPQSVPSPRHVQGFKTWGSTPAAKLARQMQQVQDAPAQAQPQPLDANVNYMTSVRAQQFAEKGQPAPATTSMLPPAGPEAPKNLATTDWFTGSGESLYAPATFGYSVPRQGLPSPEQAAQIAKWREQTADQDARLAADQAQIQAAAENPYAPGASQDLSPENQAAIAGANQAIYQARKARGEPVFLNMSGGVETLPPLPEEPARTPMGFTTPIPQLPQERAADIAARTPEALDYYGGERSRQLREAREAGGGRLPLFSTPEGKALRMVTDATGRARDAVTGLPLGGRSSQDQAILRERLGKAKERKQRQKEEGAAALYTRRTGLPPGKSVDQMVQDELARRDLSEQRAAMASAVGGMQGVTPEAIAAIGNLFPGMPTQQQTVTQPQMSPGEAAAISSGDYAEAERQKVKTSAGDRLLADPRIPAEFQETLRNAIATEDIGTVQNIMAKYLSPAEVAEYMRYLTGNERYSTDNPVGSVVGTLPPTPAGTRIHPFGPPL